MKKGLFIFILMCLSAGLSNAQALQFVKSDMDPVSSGMGGVSSVYAKSAYSAFNNMAALPFTDNIMDVALGYYDMQPKGIRVRGADFGGSFRFADAAGVAVAFSGGRGLPYNMIDMDGNLCGTFVPSEYMVSAGAAYKFGSFISVGLSAGYACAELAEGVTYGALVSDLFFMSEIYGARFALGISDIGTAVRSSGGDSYMLPTSIVVGAGYSFDFGGRHSARVAAECNLWTGYKVSASAGLAYNFADLLEIRTGYMYGGKTAIPSHWSAGAGFKFAGISLDCSYTLPLLDNRLSGTWSIGVGFTLGKRETVYGGNYYEE